MVDPPRKLQRAVRTPTPLDTAGGVRPAAGLPPDLVEKAAGRLCWIAIIAAITIVTMFFAQSYLQPELTGLQETPLIRLNALFFCLLSIGMIVLQRTGLLTPRQVLDLGLLFEIAGGFALGIFEHSLPYRPDDPVRSGSHIALWICVCTLFLPNTPLKSVAGAFFTACMGPVSYALCVWYFQYQALPANRLVVMFLFDFLFVGWAFLLNRRFDQLQTVASRAQELGSYDLVSRLGHGGMGEVWKARHRLLARESAIKLIRPEVLMEQTGREASTLRRRFEQEARATASLRSPHTVELYDFGVGEDGSFYYVMELLEGIDFDTLVRRYGPQPPARVIQLLRQVCDSLGEAHANGLVHRDIKPTNLFLTRLGFSYDFVKVLDFGLVKRAAAPDESRLTREGITTGTPAYMAPELAMGADDVDARADLYGLGCVAYGLLTGLLVFDETTPMATVLAHVQKPPVPPSQRTELPIPRPLEDIVMACLEKRPEDRPQTAVELSRRLAACAAAAGAWTDEDAARWWGLHHPTAVGVDPVAPTVV